MKHKSRKIPLHRLLVDQGRCASEKEARGWIMAGKVIVDNQRIDKAGWPVPVTSDIRIKGQSKYVGKGGFKLEGALLDFGVDVSGIVALDAGAATGGFTDCLLLNGASKVYAVDVGFGALVGKLRSDSRVVNLEKTNLSDLKRDQLMPPPALGTMDLSYLSLKKAIPILANLLEPHGEMICLVKPLFEVSDARARRTGIIKEGSSYEEMLDDLLAFVGGLGIQTRGLTHSHVTGSRGTLEFFIHLAKSPSAAPSTFDVRHVVDSALELK